MSSEGSREIEAARHRLASAKIQAMSATQMMTSAKATLDALQKSIDAAKKNVSIAHAQVAHSQKELTDAEQYLKESEKRWQVISIDEDDEPKERRSCEYCSTMTFTNYDDDAGKHEEQCKVKLRTAFDDMDRCLDLDDENDVNAGIYIGIIRKKVKNIVENANKDELTVKGVRKMLGEWLGIDLSVHKNAIRQIVMEALGITVDNQIELKENQTKRRKVSTPPTSGGGPGTTKDETRKITTEEALRYCDQVKLEYKDHPQVYKEFLNILNATKTKVLGTKEIMHRVADLFQDKKQLVLGFNQYLPDRYAIEFPRDGISQPVYHEPGGGGGR